MTELMTDLAPTAALAFVALCVVWLVWRAIRSLFGSRAREPHELPRAAPDVSRREPVLVAAPAPSSPATVPDAADVLALKASIDGLARQIALLEKRLSPANTNVPAAFPPRPAREPAIEPDARPAIPVEEPVIIPERRI
jgi:hypothetical protein